ncbi:MAG: alpha/beta hydrolase family protein, partial [Candidatus Thorarchaeota archaeon]
LYFTPAVQQEMVKPEKISFSTFDNKEAHALLYLKPDNNGKKELAPVLIYIHGGPTGMHTDTFHPIVQYFASKGYAVCAVNHRGSIGYGKEYREVLNGNWGLYDVEDCVSALKHLTEKNLVNSQKSCIIGGSAGGYTVLMSLVKKPKIYSAGIDLYGVSDNFSLAEDTHYLESKYTDSLLGPLPEKAEKYIENSPLFHAEKIIDPLLILQGVEDKVVPKSQSESIRNRVKGHVEYYLYENEGHGFSKAKTYDEFIPTIEKFLRRYVLYGLKS